MSNFRKIGYWMAAVGCVASLSATFVRGADGLAAYFAFDGDSSDSSGNGRHGIAFGPTAYTAGKIGEAVDLNGGAYIQASALNTTGSLTVSGWVMTRSANPLQTIAYERAQSDLDYCSIYSAGNYGLGIYPVTGEDGVTTGRFAFATASIKNGACISSRIVAPDAVMAGQFYCVTGVYDHSTSSERLYVNGSRVTELAGIGDSLRTRHDAVLRIGINHPASPQPWEGLIDDFRVYDRALTDAEVGSLCGAAISVTVDVKPGDFVNSINIKASGKVPAAILSTSTFDAPLLIEPTSLRLAGAGVNLIGKTERAQCGAEDVNGDGLLDLVCHFATAQFLIEPGDSVAVMEGKTTDGRSVRGQDSVRIVPD